MPRHSKILQCNGQKIHLVTDGPDDRPLMLMLHGFPELWTAWKDVADHFVDRYRIALPDQRGFNMSSKPKGEDAYHTKHLVSDMAALMDQLSPDQPIVLCGHDWGASVAYALAMRHPERVSHLIIANGVHPICFQKALLAAGPQTRASQYMNVLRAQGCEEQLAANNFEKLLGMLEKFSSAPWLDDPTRDIYRRAWSQEGALPAMLNWYRQSPMIVPPTDAPAQPFEITPEMVEKYRVKMPHLLLWGEKDTALLPEAFEQLDLFCDDLTIHRHGEASHWILHEQAEWVAEMMDGFFSAARE